MFFFQNISTNPIISYDVITLELYCSGEVATFLAFRFLLSSIKIQLFLLLSQPHLFLTHVRRVKFLHFEILSPPLRFFNLIRLGFTLRTESPSIFLDKSSFPTYPGKIEATLLAGYLGLRYLNFPVM